MARRRAIIAISAEGLCALLSGRATIIDGLPRTARPGNIGYDFQRDLVLLSVIDESFNETEDYVASPEIFVTLEAAPAPDPPTLRGISLRVEKP
jgi:hypothetical protein